MTEWKITTDTHAQTQPQCTQNKLNAGETFVSGSTVFLCISNAPWSLSTSRDAVPLTLSMSMRFTILTASSALQLACGLATDVILCLTLKHSCVLPALNCGPQQMSVPPGYRMSQMYLTRPSAADCLVAFWTLVFNSGNISCDVGPIDPSPWLGHAWRLLPGRRHGEH